MRFDIYRTACSIINAYIPVTIQSAGFQWELKPL